MEHGRSEERRPSGLRGPRRHDVDVPYAVLGVDLHRRTTDERNRRGPADPGELTPQPQRQRDVVRGETCDIRPSSLVQAPVQRSGETQLHLIRQYTQTRVVEPGEYLGGPVPRRVVDDDDLEVREC